MKISITDAAAYLECSEVKLLELLREGTLPGVKIGKAWVIPAGPFYAQAESLAWSNTLKYLSTE